MPARARVCGPYNMHVCVSGVMPVDSLQVPINSAPRTGWIVAELTAVVL